ncbi:NAD(P)-dependent oxidoreductase [Marinoscillum sp. MHG1-6]|uniref:NAD-dependent epimerase/dehydratase family protein n=1 Tax=Marinoscillum sp. MHG1-6 TaxID=2959627 RepID=UPI0021577BD4|nr:SDR family oxidoreductase [Marinoscillum sp. MHG1-6]
MNVLVTGGAGYIGTELLINLTANPEVKKIVIYDNLSRGTHALFTGPKYKHHEKLTFIEAELLDSRKLKKALEGIDVVYHLAAKVTTPYANVDAHYFEQVNHWGTAELVYAVEESDVKHFVYISSIGVYGSSSTKEIDENTEPNPRTFYAISKLRGEEHVRRLEGKIKTHIIRCGNVYGYSRAMRFDSVINKWIFESNFNNQISIHGNGKQSRAFLNIDVLCDVFDQLLTKDVPSGTYNLVERNMTMMDIVDILKAINPPLEFIFINQHLNLKSISVSTDWKLKEYLEIKPIATFDEEMKAFSAQFSF